MHIGFMKQPKIKKYDDQARMWNYTIYLTPEKKVSRQMIILNPYSTKLPKSREDPKL